MSNLTLTSKLCLGGAIWACGVGGLASIKVLNYSGDDIVMGTYEDYMSPDMQERIGNSYGIKLDYFTHDQMVGDKFRDGTYGMAVVSTSILEELMGGNGSPLVKKIDWSKLELKKTGTSGTNITSADDAKGLFTDVVQKIVEGGNEASSKFLDYGIPYFMNKLSFCYSGEKISSLSLGSPIKWSQVLDEISKEERFKPKNRSSKLGLIEDPRTVLSLARFSGDETSVNPGSEYDRVDSIYKDYEKLLNKLNRGNMGENFLYLDGTSSHLVDALVSGSINGAIMYNADCLYASYGGNLGEEHKPAKDKLHIVDISNDIYFLDFLVMSNKLPEEKENKVYEFYKSILMNGHDKSKQDILEKGSPDSDAQKLSTECEYKYWLTRNFDYVKYTPVVKNLDDGVQDSDGYFKKCPASDNHDDFRKQSVKVEFKSKQEKDIKNHYESYFSPKVKSDMLLAFSRFKDQL